MVIDDIVGIIDGGCATIVNSDVAISLAFLWLVVGGWDMSGGAVAEFGCLG